MFRQESQSPRFHDYAYSRQCVYLRSDTLGGGCSWLGLWLNKAEPFVMATWNHPFVTRFSRCDGWWYSTVSQRILCKAIYITPFTPSVLYSMFIWWSMKRWRGFQALWNSNIHATPCRTLLVNEILLRSCVVLRDDSVRVTWLSRKWRRPEVPVLCSLECGNTLLTNTEHVWQRHWLYLMAFSCVVWA